MNPEGFSQLLRGKPPKSDSKAKDLGHLSRTTWPFTTSTPAPALQLLYQSLPARSFSPQTQTQARRIGLRGTLMPQPMTSAELESPIPIPNSHRTQGPGIGRGFGEVATATRGGDRASPSWHPVYLSAHTRSPLSTTRAIFSVSDPVSREVASRLAAASPVCDNPTTRIPRQPTNRVVRYTCTMLKGSPYVDASGKEDNGQSLATHTEMQISIP